VFVCLALLAGGAWIVLGGLRGSEDEPSLAELIERGETETVIRKLEAGADPNEGEGDRYPLFAAVTNDQYDLVKLLLEKGARPETLTVGGRALLHVAAERDDAEMLRVFLDRGADPNVLSAQGFTPAVAALLAGKGNALAVLRGYGGKLVFGDLRADYVVGVCQSDDISALTEVLDEGADPNEPDGTGLLPLHVVTVRGQAAMAALLLERGADPNARDARGMTALHQAARWGRADIAELLVAGGADADARDDQGASAAIVAVASGQFELAECLAPLGTRPWWHDAEGGELLAAVYRGDAAALTALLNAGQNASVVGPDRLTPLHLAVMLRRPELVKALLAGDAYVGSTRQSGRTPLHVAAGLGDVETAGLLLDSGADVNCADAEGRTPAALADEAGQEAMVEYLLSQGGRLFALDAGAGDPIWMDPRVGRPYRR